MNERDPDNRIGYLLKRTQHALRLRMDEALRKINITTPQYAVLFALEHASLSLSGAELARRCFVTPQTMNSILRNLESAGLVARTGRSSHGRIIDISLTSRGRATVLRCHRIVQAIEEQMLSQLDTRARARLAESLLQCIRGLEKPT
jgi:DNA-binding MarR family transcriptional regulator